MLRDTTQPSANSEITGPNSAISLTVVNNSGGSGDLLPLKFVAGQNIILNRNAQANTLTISATPPPQDAFKYINILNTIPSEYVVELTHGYLNADTLNRSLTLIGGEGIVLRYNPDTRSIVIATSRAINFELPELYYFNELKVVSSPLTATEWVESVNIASTHSKRINLVAGDNISLTSPIEGSLSHYLKINAIVDLKVNTKGDLLTFSDTPTTLPLGSNNQVLSVDTSSSRGLKWVNIESILPPPSIFELYHNYIHRELPEYLNLTGNILTISNSYVPLTDNTLVAAETYSFNIPIHSKGDILTVDSDENLTRLPVGVDGAILKVSSATATGLEWCLDFNYLPLIIHPNDSSTYLLRYTADHYKRHYFGNSRVIELEPELPIGWQCEVVKYSEDPDVSISFNTSSVVTILTSGGVSNPVLTRPYGVIHIVIIDTNIAHITGAIESGN